MASRIKDIFIFKTWGEIYNLFKKKTFKIRFINSQIFNKSNTKNKSLISCLFIFPYIFHSKIEKKNVFIKISNSHFFLIINT